MVDVIRLMYWHAYAADDDTLRFSIPGRSQATVEGFSQSNIRVMDITSPHAVRELAGQVTKQETGYAVTVTAEGEDERTFLAFTDARAKQPETLLANVPSEWYQPTHAADLVIIAHAAFHSSVAPLKALREAQGLTVALIDVADVYDEFNFGDKSPSALRHFLHHAATVWQTPPRFVLLVGDASSDPHNYLELGDVDFVPTQFVATAFLETASDDWFVDFDGDSVPELAIGRLPVQTVEEADIVVAKLLGYGQTGTPGPWTRDALVVADHPDIFDFTAASTAL